MTKIYQKFDVNKVLKEMIKLAMGNSLKIKTEALNQIIMMVRDDETFSKK